MAGVINKRGGLNCGSGSSLVPRFRFVAGIYTFTLFGHFTPYFLLPIFTLSVFGYHSATTPDIDAC